MSSKDKLIQKFKTKPKDFTYIKLKSMLEGLGYKEIQGTGSRVKFHNNITDHILIIHKPHPETILKQYVINYLLNELQIKGVI